jgi:phospholipid/cholesterol/gamma-HCH transport system substrate-binding protein
VRYHKPLIGLTAFMVLSIVSTWMVFVTLRRDVEGPTNTYSALFTDVSGLHPGDDVRIAGVRVGRVDHVDLDGAVAKVTFRAQKDQVLYTNTVASVTYQNIIGQRYLGLLPGPAGPHARLSDHGQIPLEQTRPSFDIAYLLNGFEPLFTLLDPQKVDDLTNAIIKALQGDSGPLLALITQTSALADSLTGPDQILGDAITSLNDITSKLAGRASDIQALIRQTTDVIATFGNRRQGLMASAASIASTVGRLSTITTNVYHELQDLIDREPGFTGHLVGDGQARFAYLGANLPLLLKGMARVTQEGSYINTYGCNANVTIFAFLGRLIPSIVRRATPGGVIQQSPICR